MKKFFAKIALFILTSLVINSLIFTNAIAEEFVGPPTPQEFAINTAFDDINTDEMQCITEADREYIVTFIEEPLLWTGEEEEEAGAEFIKRTCYRNTLYINIKGQKARTIPSLARKCSENGMAIEKEYKDNKDIRIIYTCQEITVLLSRGGTTLIKGYISVLYKWGASIAGIIAVLVIVFSGIQLATAGGDSQAVDAARNRIIKAISGLAVLFLSGLLLYTINPNFFTAAP